MSRRVKSPEVVHDHDHANVTDLVHEDLAIGRVTDHAGRRVRGHAETGPVTGGDAHGREIDEGLGRGNGKGQDIEAYR